MEQNNTPQLSKQEFYTQSKSIEKFLERKLSSYIDWEKIREDIANEIPADTIQMIWNAYRKYKQPVIPVWPKGK